MTSEALRKILVAGVALAMLSIGTQGCAAVASAIPALGGQHVQAITAQAKQSYAVALGVYDAATAAWDATVVASVLPKATVASGRAIRLKLVDARMAALTAYNLGNAGDLQTQIATITQLAAQLKALVPLPAAK